MWLIRLEKHSTDRRDAIVTNKAYWRKKDTIVTRNPFLGVMRKTKKRKKIDCVLTSHRPKQNENTRVDAPDNLLSIETIIIQLGCVIDRSFGIPLVVYSWTDYFKDISFPVCGIYHFPRNYSKLIPISTMQIHQSFNIYNRLACLLLLLTFSPVTKGWTSINRKYNIPNVASNQDDLSRRQIFGLFTSVLTIGGISFATSSPARAFDRQIEKFSYSINIPPTMKQSQN